MPLQYNCLNGGHMKRTIATIIAGASLANVIIFWGTPAALAWAVAFGGWAGWVIDQLPVGGDRGNS